MKKAILISVSLLLVLAILAAAFPMPTLAAGPIACQKIYIVKPGDTRASVAAATGVKWADIATINNIKPDQKIKAGDKLCYNTSHAPVSSAFLTAFVIGDKVRVTSINAPSNQVYLVRARDASKTSGGWFDLGNFKALQNKTSQTSFQVPKDLKGIIPLTVCFKNKDSNKLTCMKVTK